ncbi:MAG: DnaD domain protein [Bacilli bacterium]|nr:DnaD domain protein [Bacilli bacterium]
MNINVLPADIYTVVNQTVLTDQDKKILISLYQPIIGADAISLYLSFWSDLDKSEFMSEDYTHHHLMVILKSRLDKIIEARRSLEAIGLLKSFVRKNDNLNEYIYELYSPLSAVEFFNHPVLSILLRNNIGEEEYKSLINNYKKRVIRKEGYEEITSSMNQNFKSIPSTSLEEIRKEEKIGPTFEDRIDFDLVMKSIPSGLINARTFNKRVKSVINQLSFVYNIDTIKMIEIIRLSIDDGGLINKEKLIESSRKSYEFNNNGRLPTLIYRTQPEYLKTPEGDTSNKAKIIKFFENTTPNDFLKLKNKGVAPSKYDLQTLENLALNFELSPGVINVLVDFCIRVNDGKLTRNYIETIATSFKRKGIKVVPDAMEELKKAYKKKTSVTVKKESKKDIKEMPVWMNKNLESSEMSEEDLKALEEEFKEFR